MANREIAEEDIRKQMPDDPTTEENGAVEDEQEDSLVEESDEDSAEIFSEEGIIKEILKHKGDSYPELVSAIESDLRLAEEKGMQVDAEKLRKVREFIAGARRGSTESDERALIEAVLENRHKTYDDMIDAIQGKVERAEEEGTMDEGRIRFFEKFLKKAE